MVAVDAAAGAATAVIVREGGDERVAVAGHVVVPELVDAAHSVADDRRAFSVVAR